MCNFINNRIIKARIETYYGHELGGFVANLKYVSVCAEI